MECFPLYTYYKDASNLFFLENKGSFCFTTFSATSAITNLLLQFGSKVASVDNSTFVPDPSRISDANYGGISSIDIAYDPTNPLQTDAYGLARDKGVRACCL